ncbi:MAG: transglutaminase domain-containing protein [Deltaproteobacteria bacterium]|nr:transglutaminase domain-containing protein [Deltaproteobacteria bacterium]
MDCPPIVTLKQLFSRFRLNRARRMHLLLLMVFIIACRAGGVPASCVGATAYPPDVRRVLDMCACNRGELEKFLLTYPEGDARQKAAWFIVANLPLFDAAFLNASQLRENLEYAFLSKRIMPWGSRIPREIFLHFILPHRISQEPPEPWRRRFFEELAPLFSRYTRTGSAALEILRWCLKRIQYRPTSARDLGPLSLLRRGWGRCEEQNILFIAALRSVCIPARQCYTPFWRQADGNHAWVEVWMDGRWHFLDTGMPQDALDRAWFAGLAHGLALSVVPVYGTYRAKGGGAVRSGPGYTLLNTTSSYAPTTTLNVEVRDRDGRPLPGAAVHVSIYNGGSLRPVASMVCNNEGRRSLELGLGGYLVSAASGNTYDFQPVNLTTGNPRTLTMDLGHPTPLAREYTLAAAPEPKTCPRGHGRGPGPGKSLKEEGAELARIHRSRFEPYRSAVSAFFHTGGREKESAVPPGLIRAVEASGRRSLRLLALLDSASGRLRSSLEHLLSIMDTKDLVECTPEVIPAQIALAEAARQEASGLGMVYDDTIYRQYVLNNRIYLEPWSAWRGEVAGRFSHLRGKGLGAVIARVEAFTQGLEEAAKNPLSPLMPPGLIMKTGMITGEDERAIMAVAVFRALGIPARYSPDSERVEVYSGGEWLHLPGREAGSPDPGDYGGAEKTDTSEILINFCSPDGARPGKPLAYGRNFTLCRLKGEGYFEPLHHLSLRSDKTSCRWRLAGVLEGSYFLIMGRRGPGGRVCVRISPFFHRPGETRLSPDGPWREGL